MFCTSEIIPGKEMVSKEEIIDQATDVILIFSKIFYNKIFALTWSIRILGN